MSRFKPSSSGNPNTPVLSWDRCFAKSTENGGAGVSVFNHCEIAGWLAEKLCALKQLGNQIPDSAPFLVSAHDVGKVSPGFLKHCSNQALHELCSELAALSSEAKGWEKNHSEIGEAAFCAWASDEWNKDSDWMAWGEHIGVHHGSRKSPNREGCGPYGSKEWADERRKLLVALFDRFNTVLPESPPTREQQKVLAGLTCVADWIASNEDFFPNTGCFSELELPSLIQRALNDSGWSVPKMRKGLAFEEVFPFSPNTMQQAFMECVDQRGVYVLEAPMGLGKTEAALFAAYRLMESGENSGLYFGLPTRLTSGRIHHRVDAFMEQVLEDPGFVKLIHGHAWMHSGAKEFKAGMSWFHPRKRALLASFGVGTIDQALMSVLRVKHHFVRTFGLAGKVVILDEVHSYDAYTGTLLNCLVEELLKIGCSVIILSATLTTQRRCEFLGTQRNNSAYPLISSKERSLAPPPSPNRQVEICFHGAEIEPLIGQAVAAAERGLCVLWISNTVAESQTIFDRINAGRKEGSFETGLLHSRFPAFRRGELEEKWMDALGKSGARPKGCILVATQVVEQSVDIDADLLITELAPTDMLLQRMGRLCRHERENRPESSGETWIYGPCSLDGPDAKAFKEALGNSRFVYAPFVLWKTLSIWINRAEIALPGDIRELIEATYADDVDLPDWVGEMKEEMEQKREKLQGRALGLTQLYCGDDDEDSAPTRYDTRPTISALILKECDDCGTFASVKLCNETRWEFLAGERDTQKAIAVHRNMVSLPFYSLEKPRIPAWLKSLVFGDVWVLLLQGNNLVGLDGEEVPWGYHSDKGMFKRELGENKSRWFVEDENDEFDW